MAKGTIKKLVLVPRADPPTRDEAPSEGYGIIVGDDGTEVFFLDSVVNGVAFCELKSGQVVRYAVEKGPLNRAEAVVPCAGQMPRCKTGQRSKT